MPRGEISKKFEAAGVEARWYSRWESEGAFTPSADPERRPYSMVIPPPNVTGALHMGHALNNTLQDIYARWRRMEGDDVLWLPGTDHAGIATQNVVEKNLRKEGIRRSDIGRKAFMEKVWEWKKESGGTIVRQLRRLGSSCDWTRERFTMDEGLSRAVREVFVTLDREGLLYRGNRLVNWCTRCGTALSDIEVEHEERKGRIWKIRYPFADGSGHIVIATTRPETMLGDTAVAVNPEDDRYTGLIGKELILPLVGRRIPIIADPYVDILFGTGALKVTPGHDPNDFEIGTRHNLPMIRAFTDDGRISKEMMEGAREGAEAERYIGMKIADARKACLEDLRSGDLIEGEIEHTHAVGNCYRCRTTVEPYLTPQWFVSMKTLAEEAAAAVKDGRTRIVPEHWTKTYFEWLRNIRDWCISRQIWWGHRIPAWYCLSCDAERIRFRKEGDPDSVVIDAGASPIVSESAPESCPVCGGANLVRDPDVLDTWFSSALWPFSTLGWPDKTPDIERYYPTSLLVTGFDILFFWVARMMMMGLHFMKDVPFHEVYIHALVRDSEGKKMSKSKGNVIDPLAVMDDFGTDAFRFTLAAFAAQGRDIKLDERRIKGYRNFATKVWNGARLVLSLLPEDGIEPSAGPADTADEWIISACGRTAEEVRKALSGYHVDRAAQAVYEFYWHEFCDWYLEIAKSRLREGDPSALATAAAVLDGSLRMLHPFMPFITEELHEKLGGEGFIMRRAFPTRDEFPESEGAEERIGLLKEVITAVRREKAAMGLKPRDAVEATIAGRDIEAAGAWLGRHLESLTGTVAAEFLDRDLPDGSVVEVKVEPAEGGGAPA